MVEVRRLANEEKPARPWSEDNQKKIEDLFRQPFVKPVPLAVDIADHARTLYRMTLGLGKWQDAIHLASALRWNADVMHTYDNDDLLHLTEKFTCRDGTRLRISYPDETTDGPLFSKIRRD